MGRKEKEKPKFSKNQEICPVGIFGGDNQSEKNEKVLCPISKNIRENSIQTQKNKQTRSEQKLAAISTKKHKTWSDLKKMGKRLVRGFVRSRTNIRTMGLISPLMTLTTDLGLSIRVTRVLSTRLVQCVALFH